MKSTNRLGTTTFFLSESHTVLFSRPMFKHLQPYVIHTIKERPAREIRYPSSSHHHCPLLTTTLLSTHVGYYRDRCHAGMHFRCAVEDLNSSHPLLEPRSQTWAYFSVAYSVAHSELRTSPLGTSSAGPEDPTSDLHLRSQGRDIEMLCSTPTSLLSVSSVLNCHVSQADRYQIHSGHRYIANGKLFSFCPASQAHIDEIQCANLKTPLDICVANCLRT